MIYIGGDKMDRTIYLIKKHKLPIILILIILVLLIILILKPKNDYINDIIINEEIPKEDLNSTIKVDIKGMVENSGVYEVDSNSRVIDVIEKAVLKDNANTDYLNLSKKLKDGDVIIIYSNDYIESLKKENIVYIELPCECPDNINTACIKDEIVNEEISKNNNTLVSINKATKEELMTLPGIGESKAISIIKYREDNNGFKELEEIMNVSGIGESAYEKIKERIKL